MIKKNFIVLDGKSEYQVGISKIKFNSNLLLEDLFDYIIDFNNSDLIIAQFFNGQYILNEDHIFNACYFVKKAFKSGINISNNPYIELFLYLAANRQIKVGIDHFGITNEFLEAGEILLCLISEEKDLNEILERILPDLNAQEEDININQQTMNKFERIRSFFEISEIQLNSISSSDNIHQASENPSEKVLKELYIALNNLICEKMTLLSLENK